MLFFQAGSITINTDTITLPTDYQQPYHLVFTGIYRDPGLRRRQLSDVMDAWEYDAAGVRVKGRPSIWATDASTILFNIQVDVAIPYYLKYFRALPALSPTNQTNAITSGYPKLVRVACMAKGYEYLKNQEERKYYQLLFRDELQEANTNADEELSGTDFEMEIPGTGE